jgi:hypothetical protein
VSGAVKLELAPITKRQSKYPTIIQVSGAIHEMALFVFFGCTDVVVLLAAVAVGLVSAMTQMIFLFRNQLDKN